MFFLPLLIGAAASAIGGGIGEAIKGAGRAKQEELLRQAMDEMGNIDLPTLERLAAEQLGPSALKDVTTDPRLTQAQYSDLGSLRETVDAGGLDLAAQADLNRATSRASRTAGANINRIQENLDARGAGNSAAGAVLQAQAAQDANQQAHDSAIDAAGAAWQRRMDALGKHASLAGGMRQQEYGEKSRAAEAEDSIARYNADARAAAAKYRNQVAQQAYENQYRVAKDKASMLAGKGERAAADADRTGNIATGIGNTVGTAVNAYGQQSQAEDDRKWQTEENQKNRDAGWQGFGAPYYLRRP